MLGLVSLAAGLARGQQEQSSTATRPSAPSAAPTQLQKNVEAYLRNLYAIGPNVRLTVSAPKESEVPGRLETTVDAKDGENSQASKFYVTKDGNYLRRRKRSHPAKHPSPQAH